MKQGPPFRMSTEAPEFALLKPALKALVRRIGNTEEHAITSASGTPGKGWRELHDEGWVKIHEDRACGYTVAFTLSGWEWWCRQCDAEEGKPLQELFFSEDPTT